MNPEQFNAFKYEIINWSNIPISSKNCGIGCVFCKVKRDPVLKRFPPLPDITLDELYQGFEHVDNNYRFVRLGAGVMVAAHTDPYLHPQIFDFIKHTTNYFPNKTVTTVSTGSYIPENKIDYLWSFKNFGIDLSLITMQQQRESIVPRATREKLNTILREAPIRKISLMFTGSLDELKRDLDLLVSLNWHIKAKEILVRRVENTKFSPKNLCKISELSINNYEKCVDFLKINYPGIVFTVPYLYDKYNGGSNEYFKQANQHIKKLTARFISDEKLFFNVICAESGYAYFRNKLQAHKNVNVHLIKNELYGGSITVAGLLNHQDIIRDFQPPSKNDVMVLPQEMYDHETKDITGRHYSELQNLYKAEIWIV